MSTVPLLFKNVCKHHIVSLLIRHARCMRLQMVVRGGFCYTLHDKLLLLLKLFSPEMDLTLSETDFILPETDFNSPEMDFKSPEMDFTSPETDFTFFYF